jgi:hypothetical protein
LERGKEIMEGTERKKTKWRRRGLYMLKKEAIKQVQVIAATEARTKAA